MSQESQLAGTCMDTWGPWGDAVSTLGCTCLLGDSSVGQTGSNLCSEGWPLAQSRSALSSGEHAVRTVPLFQCDGAFKGSLTQCGPWCKAANVERPSCTDLG